MLTLSVVTFPPNFNDSRDGASTASLDSLFQHHTIFSVKNFPLTFILSVSAFSLKPLPLLSLSTIEKVDFLPVYHLSWIVESQQNFFSLIWSYWPKKWISYLYTAHNAIFSRIQIYSQILVNTNKKTNQPRKPPPLTKKASKNLLQQQK